MKRDSCYYSKSLSKSNSDKRRDIATSRCLRVAVFKFKDENPVQ